MRTKTAHTDTALECFLHFQKPGQLTTSGIYESNCSLIKETKAKKLVMPVTDFEMYTTGTLHEYTQTSGED